MKDDRDVNELSDYYKNRLKKSKSILLILGVFIAVGLYWVLNYFYIYKIINIGSLVWTLINVIWLKCELKSYKYIISGDKNIGLEDWEIQGFEEDFEDDFEDEFEDGFKNDFEDGIDKQQNETIEKIHSNEKSTISYEDFIKKANEESKEILNKK